MCSFQCCFFVVKPNSDWLLIWFPAPALSWIQAGSERTNRPPTWSLSLLSNTNLHTLSLTHTQTHTHAHTCTLTLTLTLLSNWEWMAKSNCSNCHVTWPHTGSFVRHAAVRPCYRNVRNRQSDLFLILMNIVICPFNTSWLRRWSPYY